MLQTAEDLEEHQLDVGNDIIDGLKWHCQTILRDLPNQGHYSRNVECVVDIEVEKLGGYEKNAEFIGINDYIEQEKDSTGLRI